MLRCVSSAKAFLFALPCALAVSAAAEGPYGELRVGLVQDEPMVAQGRLPGFDSMLPDGDANIRLRYDDALSFGVEGGFEEVLDSPFKVGVGLDIFRMELEKAEIDAGAADGERMSLDIGPDALRARHLSFDDRVLLGTANVFYEIEMLDVTAAAGVGYGLAFVGNADAEGGPIFHLGASFEVDPLGDVGLRISRFKADGPVDDATGLPFEDFEITMLSVSLGWEF